MKKTILSLFSFIIIFLYQCPLFSFSDTEKASTKEILNQLSDLLSLNRALEIGLTNSPEINAALASLKGAKYQINVAKAGLFPRINLSSEGKRIEAFQATSSLSSDESALSADASLIQNIYTFGRLKAAIKTAKHEEAIALIKFEKTKLDVALKIEQAFLSILLAKNLKTTITLSAEVTNDLYNQAKINLEQGAGTKLDLMRAKSDLANKKAALAKAEANLLAAKEKLLVELGLEPGTPFDLKGNLKEIPHPISQEKAKQFAFEGNPNILMLSKQIESSKSKTSYENAQNRPNLEAFANYSYMHHDFSNPPDFFENDEDSKGIAGLRITFPFFDGFLAKNKALTQKTITDSLQAHLEKAKLNLTYEVHQLYLDFATALELIQAQKEAVSTAEEALGLENISFNKGRSSSRDVILATLALTNSRIELFKTFYDYQFAMAKLKNIVGNYHLLKEIKE